MGSRVLIEPEKVQEKTDGGIYIPTAKDQLQEIGTVINVGKGHILENGKYAPLLVKKGDTVVFAKFAGSKIKDKDKTYLIIEERDILARITKKEV